MMASGVRDASWSLAARGTVLLVGLANQSCLAWFLGPAARGSFAVCLLFSSLLMVTFTFSTAVALEYAVASRKITLSEGVSCAVVFALAGFVLSSAVGLILLRLPLAIMSKAQPGAFHLALLLVPLTFLSQVLLLLFMAVREFRWYATYSTMNATVQLVLTFVFLLPLQGGVIGAMSAPVLCAAVTIVAALVHFRRTHGIRWVTPSGRQLRGLTGFGIRYYGGTMSNQAQLQFGTVFLAMFASREEIGLFSVAVRLGTQVAILPDSLVAALMPRIVVDSKGRPDLVARSARIVGIACGGVLIVLAAFATPIVRVLLSPAFLPAVPVIRILTIGVLVHCACKVFVPYLMGAGRPGLASIAVATGAVVNLGLLPVLLPQWGLNGAAAAMSGGYIVAGVILGWAFVSMSGVQLAEVWRFRRSDWSDLTALARRIRRTGV